MNYQELFNKAYNGTIAQGMVLLCRYYDCGTNCRCNIGHLLEPKHLISLKWEEMSAVVTLIVNNHKNIFNHLGIEDFKDKTFLEGLQRANDKSSNIESYKINMKNFASRYDLEVPE